MQSAHQLIGVIQRLNGKIRKRNVVQAPFGDEEKATRIQAPDYLGGCYVMHFDRKNINKSSGKMIATYERIDFGVNMLTF